MSSLPLGLSSGPGVDRLVLLGAAATFAALLVVALRRSTRAALGLWLAVACFVPCWMSVKVQFDFPPTSAIGLVVLAAAVPFAVTRLHWVDWLLLSFVGLVVLALLMRAGSLAGAFAVLAQWAVGYLVGRILPSKVGLTWTYRCITVLFAVVAALAVVEFLLSWNPFVSLSRGNAAYELWGQLQERGGIVRAEGAFGHSIALGACLAMAVPVALASDLRPPLRVSIAVLLVAATVVTFSRTGIGCALLGLVLMLLLDRSGALPTRARLGLIGCLVVAAVALQSRILGVFSAAGDEATNSAAYRLDLLGLLPDVSLLGESPSVTRSPTGDVYVGAFHSIDSAWLLLGLTYGALALVLVTVVYAGAALAVLARRATAPTIAVVAQGPALVTVALITQYATVFWFFAGLAVTAQLAARPTTGEKSAEPRLEREPQLHSSGSAVVAETGTSDRRQGDRARIARRIELRAPR